MRDTEYKLPQTGEERTIKLGNQDFAHVTVDSHGRRLDVERNHQRWVFEIGGEGAELVAVYDADGRPIERSRPSWIDDVLLTVGVEGVRT